MKPTIPWVRGLALALALSLATNVAQFMDGRITAARLETAEQASVVKDTLIGVQNFAIDGMRIEGQRLADAASDARDAARAAGAADRARADRYLSLPTPTADQCEAARALVDEAIMEDRQ